MKILATILSIMLGVTGNAAIVHTATDKLSSLYDRYSEFLTN